MKIKGIIKGKVQGIGYRSMLINMALEYGIDKFNTFNTKINGEEAIICLVDSSDEIVESIKNRIIEEKPDRAIVESIEFEDYEYEVSPIERCIQAFQMEHWGRAIPILLDIRDYQIETIKEIKNVEETVREESEKTREELGGKIEEVGIKVDNVGEKVEEVGKKVDRVGEKVDEVGRKVEEVGKKVDNVGEKIDLLRMDMKEFIETNMNRMYREISEIKQALRKAGIM